MEKHRWMGMETLSGSIMNSSWRFSSVESRRHGHISMGGISRAQLCQPQSRAEQRSVLTPDVSAGSRWWERRGRLSRSQHVHVVVLLDRLCRFW